MDYRIRKRLINIINTNQLKSSKNNSKVNYKLGALLLFIARLKTSQNRQEANHLPVIPLRLLLLNKLVQPSIHFLDPFIQYYFFNKTISYIFI